MTGLMASGTGSYPPLEKGLQRNMRLTAILPPRHAPKRSIAVSAYSEQVGTYRQQERLQGLIRRR